MQTEESKKAQEAWMKKRRAAAMANMNLNNAMLMKKRMADDPALFEIIDSVARNGGMNQLLKLQSMLANYISMANYGGGTGA